MEVLQVAAAHRAARPELQSGSEISNAQPRTLEGTRILIVEDHSDSREALAELLRRLGAVTVTAESAQEALAVIGRQVPDVLISDIAMPGLDGFALMQSLNEHPAKKAGRIVSITLTGLSDPQHARRALQEGFDVCMVKPLDLGRLIDYVASAVRRIAGQSTTNNRTASRQGKFTKLQ